jgi:lipoprotein LprG
MSSRLRPLLLLLTVVPVALLGACKHDKAASSSASAPAGSRPAGDTLLKDSSKAMADIKTAQFQITADGTVAGLALHRAEGTLTREGNAKGTAQINQNGINVELQFVVVGDKIYLKGPTGGYQQLPLALAATVYDPSAILAPDKGIAKVLSSATDAKTEASEQVDGKSAYRVAANLNGADLSAVVPGTTGTVPGKLWVGSSDKRLLKATFTLPSGTETKGSNVTVTFTDFDVPADISAPQ